MMQNSSVPRPINRKLAQKRSYELAARWLALARSHRRWLTGKSVAGWASRVLGAGTEWVVNRQAKKKEAVWDAIFVRFDSVYRQILTASGCAEEKLKEETTKCLLRLEDLVTADPTYGCLPEFMWLSAEQFRKVPAESRERLRRRFHMRALLDELPPSDERGALRFLAFGEEDERINRKVKGKDLRASYRGDRRGAVELGLDLLSEFLYEKRDKVEKLTAGALTAAMLSTLDKATDLVIDCLSDDSTGLIIDPVAN